MSIQPDTTIMEGATAAADAGVRSPAQQTSWFAQNRVYLVPYLLIATPALRDPNFVQTVVLMGHHDGEGALGWVINIFQRGLASYGRN